jgi:hypothetical protein
MPAHDQTSDLANRMAGWFFVVFGLAVLFFAVAIRSTFTPETPMFVWVLIIVGVAALIFGIVAPRNLRASVLDAVVTFIWV